MKRLLTAVALLLVAPLTLAAQLTIDLSTIYPQASEFGAVRLYSVAVGTERRMSSPSFRGFRSLTGSLPGSAPFNIVTDIPASASYSGLQEYRLTVDGSEIRFVMPDRSVLLSTLLVPVDPSERGPCTVSATEPASPSPGDLWCHPTSGELQFRADGQWHAIGASGGGATVANGSITTIKLADNAVTIDKLADAVVDRWDGSVKIVADTTPSLSGRDLEFLSVDESVTRTLTLPGITIEDQGQRQGGIGDVHEVNFTGDGVVCEVVGTKATCTVTGGVSDYADLTGRPDARFEELEEFEETLRTSTPLVTNQAVSITELNTWTAIGTVSLPGTTPDRELVVSVEDVGEAARGRTRIDFDVLLTPSRLAVVPGSPGTQGVAFVQDSPGNNRYWIGVAANDQLYFAADEAGNYRITLSHSGPDVTQHLIACPNGQIIKRAGGLWVCAADEVGQPGSGEANPAAATKSEAETGTETALRSFSPLRVREAAEAAVLPQARSGDATRWPANKLPYATTQGADGIVSTNDLAKLGGIASGAEVNVQPDWNQGSSAQDSFIRNKPSVITSAERTKVGRLPTAACPVGQVWKSTGSVMTCQADATGGGGGGATPTQANVYPPAKLILQAGRGARVVADDAATTLTIEAGVPVVSEVPEDPYLNERIILDAEDDFPGDYIDYGDADLANEDGPVVRYTFVGAPVNGPQYIECYSIEYGDSAADIARRGKCYIVTGGTYSMPAAAQTRLWRSGTPATWREVSNSPPVAGLTHWYEVTGVGYADVSNTGHTYGINFRAGPAASPLYADATLEPGDYVYAGRNAGTAGWVTTPGTCDTWACAGNTDRIPAAKLPRDGFAPLTSGPGTGETITNSSQDRFLAQPVGFTPPFDLDTPLNEAGIIDVVGTFTLSGRSANSIGFNTGSTVANAEVRIDFFGRVAASSIRDAPIYDGSTNRGVKVTGTARNIHNGSAALGEVAVYLTRSTGNVMGYVVGYEGSSGALGFAIAVSMTITVQHTDLGPAATNFLELTDTPETYPAAGQHVVVNSSGDGLDFAPAPTGGGGGGASGTLSIALSGAFTPAGNSASATADRVISNAEWDGNGGITFTGGFSSGNSRTATYIVTLPQGDDNEGTARLIYNDSTSFIRVMTASRLAQASPNGRRGYTGDDSVFLEPSSGGFLSIVGPNKVDFIPDAHTSRDLLVFGREILVLNSGDRDSSGNITLTRSQATRYGNIFLTWGGWTSGNQIRFPIAGTWTLINWANNSDITWRGTQNGRRTQITRGGGTKSIITVSVDGDLDFVIPDIRVRTVTVPAIDGANTTFTVNFTRVGSFEASPFGGTTNPTVVTTPSQAGGGIVSARTNSGFTVNRLSTSYTLHYIAMRS